MVKDIVEMTAEVVPRTSTHVNRKIQTGTGACSANCPRQRSMIQTLSGIEATKINDPRMRYLRNKVHNSSGVVAPRSFRIARLFRIVSTSKYMRPKMPRSASRRERSEESGEEG